MNWSKIKYKYVLPKEKALLMWELAGRDIELFKTIVSEMPRIWTIQLFYHRMVNELIGIRFIERVLVSVIYFVFFICIFVCGSRRAIEDITYQSIPE